MLDNFGKTDSARPFEIDNPCIANGFSARGLDFKFRILDFADLTVDGSLATGGAICVVLILNGVPAPVALAADCTVNAALLYGEYPKKEIL